jgi:hypothetical protein
MTMGAKEQYEARKAAERARQAENDKTREKQPWWFNQPNPIDRFTGWLVAVTALLFVATVINAIILWITDHTLKQTLEANNRAWIAPSGALLNTRPTTNLVLEQPIEPTLLYRNSGQSPALNLGSAMEVILADSPEGTFTIEPSKICDGVAPGGSALFPSATSITISFPADNPKIVFNDAIQDTKKVVMWRGCFRYETYGKPRKTEFCFWLRKNGPQWYWHDCGIKAD